MAENSEFTENLKCSFLGCEDERSKFFKSETYTNYCSFHVQGGIFGTGESYEQYQIIENDFINFIKFVPLCQDHFDVYSPFLRDIIIRTCVQVEIFFKEWGKEICSTNTNFVLLSKYNKTYKDGTIMGAKNWGIKDYNIWSTQLNIKIHVPLLNEDILPFSDWTPETPMKWWNVYNQIKHSGHTAKKEATLEMALLALAGLFQLHCAHRTSFNYLKQFNTISISGHKNNLKINKLDITTPIDSKKYLFKAIKAGSEEFKIATKDDLKMDKYFRL